MRLTLRLRLALFSALATGLAVLLVATGLFFAVNSFLRQAQVERLLTTSAVIAVRLEAALQRASDRNWPFGLDGVAIRPADLENLADTRGENRAFEVRIQGVQGGELLDVHTTRFPSGVPLDLPMGVGISGDQLLTVQQLRGSNLRLTVISDARALGEAREAFTRALAWLLPLALLLALGVGWWVAGRLLRPVRTLENAAREVGEGAQLRRPLPGAGKDDELSRLALTLQGTFGRLADARDREQAFMRAAAHDLRSPLAALTARVEGSLARDRDPARYRSDLQEIGTDITRLSTLTNHLLLLARDASQLARAPVPLRELAADAVDRARELVPDLDAPDADTEADVDLSAPQPVTVLGDRVLLGQSIWNLTMNAVRHAPGATVTVTLAEADGWATVTVHDDGPGVGADVLARLGEAFYRPDASRSGEGHGLGLALARRAAELHGGTLTLKSAPGEGFTATLRLPEEGSLHRDSTSGP
ncbi:HAMP domain-containing sensor histidine kinase [Deinococcus sp. AJ005]|uniref:sensor histidine kinase n=1 Tax=Deinococcus sp. AJ005 TaxID=2652443 RepID=UPI00125CD18B|nr:HAMP domain-containing sensor histidine kinase [Deinococcus sp. AJ005]QFP77422.1 HAMP domain-containing histidine kinase [Deinococcus sp. AJ005]